MASTGANTVKPTGRITFVFDWNAQQAGAAAMFFGNEMTATYN
jgi:hypothetical protein